MARDWGLQFSVWRGMGFWLQEYNMQHLKITGIVLTSMFSFSFLLWAGVAVVVLFPFFFLSVGA